MICFLQSGLLSQANDKLGSCTKQAQGDALLRGYRQLWSEYRLRFIASWTGMYTDPTAWPLHENTMLEGAKAD